MCIEGMKVRWDISSLGDWVRGFKVVMEEGFAPAHFHYAHLNGWQVGSYLVCISDHRTACKYHRC